ncbi:MAG: hypothetical protein BWY44_00037 [Candidatus Omnitrophica bacterium ADurb.Bin292]|nr:MAG: hypothetical protein BWY44_00037 [Candidatus Omnitrophica bacterium ADurb.Bin292]
MLANIGHLAVIQTFQMPLNLFLAHRINNAVPTSDAYHAIQFSPNLVDATALFASICTQVFSVPLHKRL